MAQGTTTSGKRCLSALTVLALVMLSGCGSSEPKTAGKDGSLSDLAREEGEVLVYSAMPDSVNEQVGQAFDDEYGIDVQFVRLTSAPLAQRYSAEADSDSVVADLVITTELPFIEDGIEKGWMTPLSEANLPTLVEKAFPDDYVRDNGTTAVLQVVPWGAAYNTELVDAADVPTEMTDLADPKWRGKILMTDPTTSGAYAQFWDGMLNTYGEDFLRKIGDNEPTLFDSGTSAAEALAAGEGAVVVPLGGVAIQGPVEAGAPLALAVPDTTVGIEMLPGLSADAPHPNAARLFIDYMLSEEGNKVLNDVPDVASVYGSGLPVHYLPPKVDITQESADNMFEMLGVE